MTISFTPALGEVVRIPAPYDAVTVRLRFTAVLFVREYRHYERHGARIQVWCELPDTVNDILSSAQWRGVDFEDPNGEAPGDCDTLSEYDQIVLPLALNAALKPGTKSFSFTYRILFPTGEVRWLGTPDKNGAFVIRRHKMREKQDEVQSPNSGAPLLRANLKGKEVEGKGRAEMNENPTSIPTSCPPLNIMPRKAAPTPTLSMLNDPNGESSKAREIDSGSSFGNLNMPGGLYDTSLALEGARTTLPGSYADTAEMLRVWRDDFAPRRPAPHPRSAALPPSSNMPSIPDAPEPQPPRSTPLMVWGWLLDEDIYLPGSHPICHTLSERYERFLKALKTAKLADASRFKGFVSNNSSGEPVSQFCFHFASNRNEKDMKRRLSRADVSIIIEAAKTSRRPAWIEIPCSESPQYLPVHSEL